MTSYITQKRKRKNTRTRAKRLIFILSSRSPILFLLHFSYGSREFPQRIEKSTFNHDSSSFSIFAQQPAAGDKQSYALFSLFPPILLFEPQAIRLIYDLVNNRETTKSHSFRSRCTYKRGGSHSALFFRPSYFSPYPNIYVSFLSEQQN